MPRSEARVSSRARLAAPLAVLAVAVALAPVGCGGGEPAASSEAEQTAPAAPPGERSTAQPPPETAPDDASGESEDAGSSEEAQEEALAEDPETGPLPCPDVVIAPDSGNGLFDVEANGLTCEDATAALEAWGSSGFPGTGPPGFSCDPVPGTEGRLSCVQDASGGAVEFTQGV